MNDILIKKIEQEYKSLSKTHRIIADILFDDEIEKQNLTLSHFSKMAFCSPSTILKFINLFNYTSYRVFLNDFLTDDVVETHTINLSFQLVEKYYINNEKVINELIDAILKAKRVFLFSSGLSKLAAYDFTYKCKYQDTHKFIDATTEAHFLDDINKDDLAIFISNSGDSKPLSIIAKSNKCKSFLITNRENSVISKNVDTTINLNNNVESPSSFSLFPKESKYSLIYFFDLLHEKLYLQ